MNTTGKDVDSVIQYQLHKDCNGGGELSPRFINETYLGEITATQEDIDNYGYLGINALQPLEIGKIYKVYELPASFNDLKNNIAFIVGDELSTSELITIYGVPNDLNDLYIAFATNSEWYCLKNNLNLRRYTARGIG